MFDARMNNLAIEAFISFGVTVALRTQRMGHWTNMGGYV